MENSPRSFTEFSFRNAAQQTVPMMRGITIYLCERQILDSPNGTLNAAPLFLVKRFKALLDQVSSHNCRFMSRYNLLNLKQGQCEGQQTGFVSCTCDKPLPH